MNVIFYWHYHLTLFNLQKYVGPKLAAKLGMTKWPNRDLWKQKVSLKLCAMALVLWMTTFASVSMFRRSIVAWMTPSFWGGDRVHVEYTMMPPGRHFIIALLHGIISHWSLKCVFKCEALTIEGFAECSVCSDGHATYWVWICCFHHYAGHDDLQNMAHRLEPAMQIMRMMMM